MHDHPNLLQILLITLDMAHQIR